MVRNKISIHYKVDMLSRFHCGTGYSFGLIDEVVRKDRDGYLYLPGSTIKGLLRESCEKILRLCKVKVRDPHNEEEAMNSWNRPQIPHLIFGSRFSEGEIYFNHAKMISEDKEFFHGPIQTGGDSEKRYLHHQVQNLSHTTISQRLGTVKRKALFNLEYGLKGLTFEGCIFGSLKGNDLESLDKEGTDSLVYLLAALISLESIGGERSRGAGRCCTTLKNLLVDDEEKDPFSYFEIIPFLKVLHDEEGEV